MVQRLFKKLIIYIYLYVLKQMLFCKDQNLFCFNNYLSYKSILYGQNLILCTKLHSLVPTIFVFFGQKDYITICWKLLRRRVCRYIRFHKFFKLYNLNIKLFTAFNCNIGLLVYDYNYVNRIMDVFFKLNLVNINYFLSRFYLSSIQTIMNLKLYCYFVRTRGYSIYERKVKKLILKKKFFILKFLKRFHLNFMFFYLLIKSIYNRNISIYLYCIRKIILTISYRSHRRFIFLTFLFFREVAELLSTHFCLESYKFVFRGKFGAKGSNRRSVRYLARGGTNFSFIERQKMYDSIQIRLLTGVLSLRGFFVFRINVKTQIN